MNKKTKTFKPKQPFIPNKVQDILIDNSANANYIDMGKAIRADIRKLNKTADEFNKLMKSKLKTKALKGVGGWDNSTYTVKDIQVQIVKHLGKLMNGEQRAVDIANLCMFYAFKNGEL